MKSFCVMWKIYFDTLVLCIIVILGNFKTDRKFSQKSIRSDTFRKTKLIFPWQLFIFNFIYFSEKHTFAYYFQIRSKIGIKLKPFFIIFLLLLQFRVISCDHQFISESEYIDWFLWMGIYFPHKMKLSTLYF